MPTIPPGTIMAVLGKGALEEGGLGGTESDLPARHRSPSAILTYA